jgi:hypothetical protein
MCFLAVPDMHLKIIHYMELNLKHTPARFIRVSFRLIILAALLTQTHGYKQWIKQERDNESEYLTASDLFQERPMKGKTFKDT